MKRKFFLTAFALILSVLMLGGTFSSYADGSHGFFMDCDASVVGGKSDGFMIDFYSDSENALCTYFSNANWGMYTEATAKRFNYKLMEGGGAYAGLQLRGSLTDRTGIMSFWRYDYTDGSTGEKKHLYAEAVYGKTTTYDNEGSGTSCVMPFNWKNNRWYRQLLFCWQDIQTGYTYMGTWFYDYEEDVWTLFAYYDTKLVGSYIQGGVGQFLENYSESQGARYRSFRYRNIYFLSHDSGQWVSSPTVKLRSDGNPKAFGEAKLGVSDDNTYVWASVDGTSEIDTDHQIKVAPTLSQAEKPIVGTPKIDTVSVQKNGDKGLKVSWEMDAHSTPQLVYTLKVFNTAGKQIGIRKGSRPEVVSEEFDTLKTDAVRVELTVTDVFGQSTSLDFETESYQNAIRDSEDGEGSQAQTVPSQKPSEGKNEQVTKPQGNTSDGSEKQEQQSALPLILGAAAGGVLTLCILLLVLKKRKK